MSRAIPLVLVLTACSASGYREDADEQVYSILAAASERVTGEAKSISIDRPMNTLRARLLAQSETIKLDLTTALDVAAENSREFQTQKETLYRAGLALTLAHNDFTSRFSGVFDNAFLGIGSDGATWIPRNDLSASRNTESGGRIVAGFVNSWLFDVINGGGFNGASILGLEFTQPLLRGFGRRIAREPLTQAERDVIYAVRTFERFRTTFAVSVVTAYLRLLQQIENLASEEANVASTRKNREEVQAKVEASRLPPIDLDRAQQTEFSAQDRLNNAQTALRSAYDRFKLTLGIPTDTPIELDLDELESLRAMPVTPVDIDQPTALRVALARRLDYRVTVDDVEDAARHVMITEDALRSMFDLSSAIDIPTEPGKPLKFDWSQVNWSVGFRLDLALDRLPERNAYRTALINFERAVRAREQAEDTIKQQVRDQLRNVARTRLSHQIQSNALELSKRRVERADDFLKAGRGNTLALLDAQQDLLGSKLSLTGAIVDYAIARLNLVRDLDGLLLESKGLHYDRSLPLPDGPFLPYRSDMHGAEYAAAAAPVRGDQP